MTFLIASDIDKIVSNTKMMSKYFSGKKILITGGNGFLGKYFVQVFNKYNYFLKKPINLIVYDKKIDRNNFY